MLKTTWDHSLETESLRILHTARNIANGFYRLNGFIVLPGPITDRSDNFVALPRLPYLSIPRFWQQCAKLDIANLPIEAPKELVAAIQDLMAKVELPKPEFAALQALWTKHQDQILSMIYDLMPSYRHRITEITIYPTAFGTGCSFNRMGSKPGPMHIWLREGKGLATIVEAIITALTRNDIFDHLQGVWQESEIITDWLLAYSNLNSLLVKLDPTWQETLTIKSTRIKQNAKLALESEKFLQSLGLEQAKIDFQRISDLPNMTPSDKQVLSLLVTKAPNIVTNEEIDMALHTNSDNFSLYAISKAIQRLRDHLEASGISGSIIQTKRGVGYVLVN
jgi:hypothetical protein